MVTHFAYPINIFSGCERPPSATVYRGEEKYDRLMTKKGFA
jgi:hypothetical protein